MFRKNKGKAGEVVVTDEDKKIIDEILTPYWTGKDYATNFVGSLPEETRFHDVRAGPQEHDHDDGRRPGTSIMRHSQNWTPDWNKLLTRGVKGIREEAQAKLAALSNPRDLVHKRPFLEAVIMTCDAMTTWSRRYAKLATELAAKEKDQQRKKELQEIAEACEWVPEHPARTFREALQAQWWGQMFNRIELTSSSMGQGRWDQYMLPFYRKDLAEGRITEESATELLHCVWLNMQQCVEIKLNPVAAAGTEGFSKFEDICLGGQTPDGKDATNELTYLILESTRDWRSPPPNRACAFTRTRQTGCCTMSRKSSGRQGLPEAAQRRAGDSFYLANGGNPPGGASTGTSRLHGEPPDQQGDQRHRQRRNQLRLGR